MHLTFSTDWRNPLLARIYLSELNELQKETIILTNNLNSVNVCENKEINEDHAKKVI